VIGRGTTPDACDHRIDPAEAAAEEKSAMTELETHIADNRAAVDEFIAAARAIDGVTWTTPRAERAWCPAQIVEHVALTYEYNRRVLQGTAEGLPFPISLLKPLIRRMVVDNTLRAGRFTRKGRAPKFFQPSTAPPAASDVIARLTRAVAGFEADLRSRPRGETIDHPVFGTVRVTDWVALQAIHARHHRAQLTGG
jgi:Protein of unknown function (DUF1569)